MNKIVIPGSLWVLIIAILNAVPAALAQAYPAAIWVAIATDTILVVVKMIEVYAPKTDVIIGGDMVAPAAAPAPERGKLAQLLWG